MAMVLTYSEMGTKDVNGVSGYGSVFGFLRH